MRLTFIYLTYRIEKFVNVTKDIGAQNILSHTGYSCLHSRLMFPLVLPMPEISSGMGVPDESRAVQCHA
jgi:hypothetical protein